MGATSGAEDAEEIRDTWPVAIAAAAVIGVASTAWVAFGTVGGMSTTTSVVAAAITVVLAAGVATRPFPGDAVKAVVAGGAALVLALVGLHWTGLPVVLGVAGALGGMPARTGDRRTLGTVAAVAGVSAVLIALGIVIIEPLTD